MPDRAKIGFVIASFGREQYLALAIESIQKQSVREWQLVVVDDGSPDRSLAVAQRIADQDPRIRVLSQSNAGTAAARNRGLRTLDDTVELVTFLDDDDVLEPEMAQRLAAILEANPRAAGAYGLARMIDGRGLEVHDDAFAASQTQRLGIRGSRLALWPTEAPTTFAVLAFLDVIPSPGQVLMRRSALAKAGQFRAPAEDWDLFLRLTRLGDLVFVPKVVLGYRWHEGNVSRSELRMSKAKLIVNWRLLWSPELSASERRTAWLAFLYYYADLGRVGRTARRVAVRAAGAFRAIRSH